MNLGCPISLGFIFGDGEIPLSLLSKAHPRAIIWLGSPVSCEVPSLSVHLGEIGKALAFLREHSVTHLTIVGNIPRPTLSNLRLDTTGMLWLKRLGRKFFQGDDALLKGIHVLLEEEGFTLIPSTAWSSPLPRGVLSKRHPLDESDITFGFKSLEVLSPLDVGQALIVERGRILGIEAAEGTDALILRCAPYVGDAAILIKASKLNQLNTLDIPTIGVMTIENIRKAGLIGLAITSTQVVNVNVVIDACNDANIFFVHHVT